ncbi:MAG: dihydrolipoyl dehydrogenase [Defluviitaleaceae bacterium]|nr:dihydrolipoyl dehydrogenase [Defluviitaleaceae bacterium]
MGKYELIIIGGGPAGYLAAERAAQGGMNVLLFEKRKLGGVCLNEGCMPTKTLLHSAKLYYQALNGKAYGVSAESVSFDHGSVVSRKNKVVKTLVSGVTAKMKGHKISVINETAVIAGKSNGVFAVNAGNDTYEARLLLVAAGSEAVIPPIPGLKEGLSSGFVMTSREILDTEHLPQKLAIIGGGVIGLEMAAYFATAGSKVTVIEMLDKIAGYTDGEISAMLQNELAAKGIDFRLGCKVVKIGEKTVEYEKDGVHTVEADAVLLSIGRKASAAELGLENIGVYTERGAIVTDNNLRTNVPGCYAAGDVNGKSMLAHTAYREAEAAVNHMLGKRDSMRYDAIPAVIYTSPEVSGVGETEESAREKGLNYSVKKLSMRYSGRFIAETDHADGLCKLLLETGSNRLIGAHLIGNYASEIIYGAAMMIESRWPADDLKEIVFPHPTVSEIIKETLFV